MTATPPECARLAAKLRGLRERSGLSLSALADRSAYSRSSWQRYLAGTALPPWSAVRALCDLADESEPRLRALWELADYAWSRRTATHPAAVARSPQPVVPPAEPATLAEPAVADGPAPAPATGPGGPSPAASAATANEPSPAAPPQHPARRSSRRRLVGMAAGVFLALACLLLSAAAWPWSGPRRPTGLSAAAYAGYHVGCTGDACDGRDPGVTLCGVEPQTLLHVQIPAGFGLEVRYNPQCRAVWARVWNAASGDRLTLTAPGRPAQSVTVAHPVNQYPYSYTPLMAVSTRGTTLRVCVAAGPDRTPTCYTVRSP